MKPSERIVSRLLRSRLGAYILVGFSVMFILIGAAIATLPPVATARGLVTGMGGAPSVSGIASLTGELALISATMTVMAFINRAFNLLRSSSILFIGVFGIMEAASPIISTRLSSGMLVALVVLCAMGLMYSVYQKPRSGTKRIFLAFSLLSFGSMAQYAFVAYLPVFLAGCAQMRCFTFRTLLAACVGIIVPWWIMIGFGIISISDLTFPFNLSIFSQLEISGIAQLIAVIVVTVITGFSLTLVNMIKIYSYNARSRSFNGLLVTVTIATLLLTMIDFANVTAYLTLLNCCVAYQTALCFRINYESRGYIPVVVILSVYFILFAWSLFI